LGSKTDQQTSVPYHQHLRNICAVWRRPLSELVVSVEWTPAVALPYECRLLQNYSNPFNPSSTIRYGLPGSTYATLTVFNTLGQLVASLVNGEVEAGYHEVKFDGDGLSNCTR
jgi:hypothetical protein